MPHSKTAPVDMFTTLRPKLLLGQTLKDIKSVQASIARFGLLSPIVVTRQGKQLIVIDGRKRLAAIRRLGFMGRLPRSLVNIPYVELTDIRQSPDTTPSLMSNRELYKTVVEMFRETQDIETISRELYLSRKCVAQVLTLARLSPRLRRAFFDQTIDFERARAYAAIPGQMAQENAFAALGPFADANAIIDYVQKPQQVVEAPLAIAA